MSSKFKSEYVVVLINIFKWSAFSSMLRASCRSKQHNKLVLRLNSFKNGALFGISLKVIEASRIHIWVAHWPNAENRGSVYSQRKDFAIKWHLFPRLQMAWLSLVGTMHFNYQVLKEGEKPPVFCKWIWMIFLIVWSFFSFEVFVTPIHVAGWNVLTMNETTWWFSGKLQSLPVL